MLFSCKTPNTTNTGKIIIWKEIAIAFSKRKMIV